MSNCGILVESLHHPAYFAGMGTVEEFELAAKKTEPTEFAWLAARVSARDHEFRPRQQDRDVTDEK